MRHTNPPPPWSQRLVRLENAEAEIIQETEMEGEEAVGRRPSPVTRSSPKTVAGTNTVAGFANTRPHSNPSIGADGVASKHSDRGEIAAGRRPGGASRASAGATTDEDRDARELESMLMGLEIDREEPSWAAGRDHSGNTPVVDLTGEELGDAAVVGRGPGEEGASKQQSPSPPALGGSVVGPAGLGGHAVAGEGVLGDTIRGASGSASGVEESFTIQDWDFGGAPGEPSSSRRGDSGLADGVLAGGDGLGGRATTAAHQDDRSPAPFTISDVEGEAEDGERALRSKNPAAAAAAAAAASADADLTRDLLGSIAETLTPSASAEARDGAPDSPPLLLVTKSELSLVNLMAEAGEESGELLGAGSRAPEDESPRLEAVVVAGREALAPVFGAEGEGAGAGRRQGRRPAPFERSSSAFDDALFGEGSEAHTGVSADDGLAARFEGGVSSPSRGGGGGGVKEAVVEAGRGVKALSARGKVLMSGVGRKVGRGGGASDGAVGHSHAAAAPVFSLGHERWVTCGFASSLTVSRAGHEDAVGRALRDASSVLALDSMNYFLSR